MAKRSRSLRRHGPPPRRLNPNWRVTNCPNCSGHGQVWSDWMGADECRECGGGGDLWILPSGHCFSGPGGQARGMWSHEEWERSRPPTWLADSNEARDRWEVVYRLAGIIKPPVWRWFLGRPSLLRGERPIDLLRRNEAATVLGMVDAIGEGVFV